MSDLGADDYYLEYICGGPKVETDHRALSIARNILDKYNVSVHEQSQGIRNVLLADNHGELSPRGASGASPLGSSSFKSSVDNIVVASSRDSIDEMALAVFHRGYVPIKIYGITGPPSCQISLRQMSQDYALLASLMILFAEEKITRTEMYDKIRENIVSLDLTEETLVFPSKENWARGLYLLVCPSSSRFSQSSRSAGTLANNQQLAIFFSLDWYLMVERYPILKEYIVWFLGGASSGRDGNTPYSGAYAYGNLAVDVYRKFVMPPVDLYEERSKTNTTENPVSREEKRRIHESILPHKAIASEQPNFFFRNVNAGAELLELTGSTEDTHTKVGDLHILRIVRSPCRCCCCSLDHLGFSER